MCALTDSPGGRIALSAGMGEWPRVRPAAVALFDAMVGLLTGGDCRHCAGNVGFAPTQSPAVDRGASQNRHIAVASFRCVTATYAGVLSPALGSTCSECHR